MPHKETEKNTMATSGENGELPPVTPPEVETGNHSAAIEQLDEVIKRSQRVQQLLQQILKDLGS